MCSRVCSLSHLVTWNRTHCTLYTILACRNVWITRSRGLHLTHNSRLQCRIMQRLPFDHSPGSLIDLRFYDFILSRYKYLLCRVHSYIFLKNLEESLNINIIFNVCNFCFFIDWYFFLEEDYEEIENFLLIYYYSITQNMMN